MRAIPAVLIVTALTVPCVAGAQTSPRPTTPAAADSGGTAPAAARPARQSWTSDRVSLRVGDIITVVVDEATSASEKVSKVAQGDHSLDASLNAGIGNEDMRIGPQKAIGSGLNSDSRDVGEAGRRGNLSAVLTVRVTAIEPDGSARIEGTKLVTVDGRAQEVTLRGLVRPQDVSTSNCVLSNRVANAEITYKGKKIGPSLGIVGRLLAMLWP